MIKQIFTSILALATVTAFGQSGFEGTVVLETTTAKTNEEATVVLHIKDSNSRMDFESVTEGHEIQYSVIVDDKGSDLISKGEVTKIDLNSVMPPKGNMQPVLREGDVEKNGYPCTHYQFSDGEQTIDYWLTESLGVSMSDLPLFLQQGMPKPEDGKLNGIPVAMVVVDSEGKTVSTQKLVSVNPSRVDEALFERK